MPEPRSGDVVDHALQSWFDSYLRVCNRHTYSELVHFLAADVLVNGQPGRSRHIEDLRAVARGFPDFRQTLQQLVINSDGWLGARFRTSGTHLGSYRGVRGAGGRLGIDEVVLYRVTDFMITEIRTTTDHRRLLNLLGRTDS